MEQGSVSLSFSITDMEEHRHDHAYCTADFTTCFLLFNCPITFYNPNTSPRHLQRDLLHLPTINRVVQGNDPPGFGWV